MAFKERKGASLLLAGGILLGTGIGIGYLLKHPEPASEVSRGASRTSSVDGALLEENPLSIFVTVEKSEISRLFHPPQPQRDIPVAAAVYKRNGDAVLGYDEVRLKIPAWKVDTALVEKGRPVGTVTQYWYGYNDRRPDEKGADMKIVGYRQGREMLLYQGRVGLQERSSEPF